MRQLNTILGTGCFLFCLGGWVYSDSAIGADSPKVVKEAALDAAVAAAAAGTVAETRPAAEAPASKDLTTAVVNVGADGMVEQFNAQDLDINTALHFLSLQSKRNIVASKEVKGTITANLYNVTFKEALESILQPNGFDFVERGNFIYVYTIKELEDIRKRDRKPVNKTYRLKYLTAQDASILIKPLMSADSAAALTPPALIGLPAGISDTGGMNYGTDDTLVIRDYPEVHAEIAKTIKELDVRPKQVLIESTILRAQLKEDNALGIDFVSLSGMDFGGTGGRLVTDITKSFQDGTVPASPAKGVIGTDFANKVPSGGLSVGFLSNNVSFYLRALEEITDATVVANPKILALNKHKGEVFIGQQFGYKTTSTTSTTTQETVEFLDTGTKLTFRPFIGDDGYVRMEIHPEDSSGGLNSSGLPEKASTEITTNLMVKDGRTIVIGGLFREQTTASRGQVPILGNIPVLGTAFRRTNDSAIKVETMVLITPHIINDDTSIYVESEKQAADVNRMMLGNRAGLQPWGRDRIAQLWFSKAQEMQDAENKEKALMYCDWALNSNPRFIEAIKMKEKLTGKIVKEADQTTIRNFVQDTIKGEPLMPNTGTSGHYVAPRSEEGLTDPATPPATAPAAQP